MTNAQTSVHWIYFASRRSGETQIWKIPFPGNESDAVQVTKNGCNSAFESFDGQYLYVHKINSGIRRMPIDGGEEKLIFNFPIRSDFWAVSKKGIYFFNQKLPTGGEREICFLDFETTEIQSMYKLNANGSITLTISHDNKYLLYSQSEGAESDIWLVENWR